MNARSNPEAPGARECLGADEPVGEELSLLREIRDGQREIRDELRKLAQAVWPRANEKEETILRLLRAINDELGAATWTAADLLDEAASTSLGSSDLPKAIVAAIGPRKREMPRRLGIFVAKSIGRWADMHLERVEERTREGGLYRVVRV